MPLSGELIAEFGQISSATVHEAEKTSQVLPVKIRPLTPEFKVYGTAFTVKLPPGENYMLHQAIYQASAGDVIVADADGYTRAGAWGEIMTVAAMKRGLAGLVFNGAVRDRAEILALGFPVFCRSLCIRGTLKTHSGWAGRELLIGGARVRPGDLVLGDCDGIVIVEREKAAEALELARAREKKECEVKRRLAEGETTLEIYGF